MRLRHVRAGDIVRAHGMHAVVLERAPRELVVRGIGNGAMRHVKAREIEIHWRRAREHGR